MEKPKNQATLCIPLHVDRILLGMKKRGFGVGKYNGFGGKLKPGETAEEASIREFQEESGLCSQLEHLLKVAEIDFYFPHQPGYNQTMHVYLLYVFSGEPKETEEMAFKWFNRNEIPYHQMWDDDRYWLPLVLEGKCLRGTVIFKEENGEHLIEYKEINIL